MKENKDPDLVLYDELFTAQAKLQSDWEKSERYYEAKFSKKQYDKLVTKKRSKIFIPKIRNIVNIIRAIFSTAFFSGTMPIELLALNDEEKETLTDRNKVLKYYYKKLKPNKELLKAFLSALLFRMGIVTTYWDKQKKKVITQFVPVTDIAFDNECTGIDDIECLAYRHNESTRITLSKIKSGYYNQKGLKKKLYKGQLLAMNKRKEVKTIFKRALKGGYEAKVFIDEVCVRIATYERLPFQYGYALDKLPSVIKDKRKDQILCYGGNIVEITKELNDELNQKRNLKNDIQEEILNPTVYVNTEECKVDPKHLTKGASKKIPVKGKLSGIQERPPRSEYALNHDVQLLENDMRDATGVNSIQEGQTGASDRRSLVAMSFVNSNSSMRIEEMINFIKETLYEHWAKTWVELVMKNADDEVINKITGKENPFGVKGKRKEFEYTLQINFGMTVDKERRITDLATILQMILQNPNIRPDIAEGILKEILDLRIGENTNLAELFSKKIQQKTQEDIKKDEYANGTL